MASKRRIRRKACRLKRMYLGRGMAEFAAYQARRRTLERIQAYRCGFCGNWHLGHWKG